MSMYVDDVVTGEGDKEQAYDLYLKSKDILKEGGFNLRKFVTNAPSLQLRFDKQEKQPVLLDEQSPVSHSEETYTKATLAPSQPVQTGEQKILGVRWTVEQDQLLFGLTSIAQQASQLEPTKRNIVSVVGRFYDPLGFLSPVVIRFKMLFQELCEKGQDWDDPLTDKLLDKLKELVKELEHSPVLSLPRCVWKDTPSKGTTCSL